MGFLKKRYERFKIHHVRPKKSIVYFMILLLLFISWALLMYYVSPDKIISILGINNSYLIVLFLGIIGGISIMFPIPYYLAVFTFAAGGSNPILLGISAGIGVIIGDSTSYFLGYHGSKIIPIKFQKISQKVSNFIITVPDWLRYLVLFLWGSITPFPNDTMLVPLGLIRYPYIKIIVPLGLGNIVFNIIIALGGYYGIHLFF